jgi:hypothetical protein
MSTPGKLEPPYGGVTNCANTTCERELSEDADKGDGAYLFKNHASGKVCVFCGDCARHVELNHREQFTLIAL